MILDEADGTSTIAGSGEGASVARANELGRADRHRKAGKADTGTKVDTAAVVEDRGRVCPDRAAMAEAFRAAATAGT
jgi:hypothetical protein